MKQICILFFLYTLSLPLQATTVERTLHIQNFPQASVENIEITAYKNRLKVKNAPVGKMLELYSVVGIKVKEIKITSANGEYIVNIPKGYYIIRIGETVRKVVIR